MKQSKTLAAIAAVVVLSSFTTVHEVASTLVKPKIEV